MNSWYGKSSNRQLQILLDNKPNLSALLACSQFNSQLKAYNTKLLEYITNNSSIITETIKYIIQKPTNQDSSDRKFKLPMQSIELIETQTTCVLNGFFKEIPASDGQLNIDLLFDILNENQILPMLAGYFFRANFCLLNNRYKQTITRFYCKPKLFQQLIQHSYHLSITNVIQLYLNLDINKVSTANITSTGFLEIKINALKNIINRIDIQYCAKSNGNLMILQNLCGVLIQTIQKHYLIMDGTNFIEIIISQYSINIIMNLIRCETQYISAGFSIIIALINYISFSSFNVDDINNEIGKKNIQRLQNQPFIIQLCNYFPIALQQIMKVSKISLYHYKMLEVLCHCISICSQKILQCIKQTRFFCCLIKLLFKHQNNNILHTLIQKSFLHIFISERKIYQTYKHHLFCEMDIIKQTAQRVLQMYSSQVLLQNLRKKAYFGHFMYILKIYSNIQTTNKQIIQFITSKSVMWNKITNLVISPYQNLTNQELGTYEYVPQQPYQEFKVTNIKGLCQTKGNTSIIQEIKRQQIMEAQIKPEKREEQTIVSLAHRTPNIQQEQQLFKMPKAATIAQTLIDQKKQFKKTESFREFMSKKKVQVEQQIKLKRSLSQERKLSKDKMTRMKSPSPSKKNSWRQQKEEAVKITRDVPKIPLNRKNIPRKPINDKNESLVNTSQNKQKIINMDQIKKLRVYQIQAPKERKYRQIEEKDYLLLDLLGIAH